MIADETFADEVSILDDLTKNDLTLARCTNQLFISNLTYLPPFSYTSPLSIKYVHEGQESYKVNGLRTRVTKGQCLIVNDGCDVLAECGMAQNKDYLNRGMSIFLSPQIISDVVETCKTWPNGIIPEEVNPAASVQFYDGIVKNDAFLEFIKKQFLPLSLYAGAAFVDEAYYYGICENMVHFQYRILQRLYGIKKVRQSTKNEILKRVLQAKEIIDDNYLQKFELDYLAAESCLSKFFLIKCFKQVFNITPHQYHIQVKINKAKELLQTKQLTVAEIAAALNYPGVESFSKQFKMVTRCSPSGFGK